MKSLKHALSFAAFVLVSAVSSPVLAQDSSRKELQRVDLSGAPGTGASVMNLRDVPHAGFRVVGDKTIKLLTVHIVDKGKPLYDWVKK